MSLDFIYCVSNYLDSMMFFLNIDISIALFGLQESHLQRHFIYHAKRGEMTPDGAVLTPDGDIVNSDQVTSAQVTSVLEDEALDSIEAIINDNTDMDT